MIATVAWIGLGILCAGIVTSLAGAALHIRDGLAGLGVLVAGIGGCLMVWGLLILGTMMIVDLLTI